MRLIGGDFETYWAPDYTLSKMTTESYVRDPRFEPIMLCLGTSRADMATAYGHTDIAYLLKQYDWNDTMFIAHNNMFDGFILGEQFGVYPKAYACTMSMSRALGLHIHGGASLDKLTELARRCGVDLPQKGHQVESYKGFHLADFSPAQLADYTSYCQSDTISTYGLFQWYMKLGFPMAEVRAVDEFIRLMAEPRLALDGNLLARRLATFEERRINMLERLGVSLQQIRSDAMFADLLRQYNVDPPMKFSPKRRNPDGSPLAVYAFSKTDDEFTDLQEHDDPDVQLLVSARLKLKSTIEESRMNRLLGISERGLLPVPLQYYGAHTGRPAATGKINMANLTRPANPRHNDEGMLVKLPGDRFEHIVAINNRTNGKPPTKFMVKGDSAFWSTKKHYLAGLRDCIVAPPGHVIGVSDLNAIEARGLAWLAQQLDVLANFKESDELPPDLPDSEVRDVYTRFGDVLYGRTITKADKRERQMSKVCIAEGSLVLTDQGLVPIEEITVLHRVWDGVEWVSHQGVVCNGTREVITYCGITATPDHWVFTADGALPLGDAASRLSALAVTGYGGEAIRLGQDHIYRDSTSRSVHSLGRSMHGLRYSQVDQQGELDEWKDKRVSSMLATEGRGVRDARAAVRCDLCEMQEPEEPGIRGVWRAWYRAAVHLTARVLRLGKSKPTAPNVSGSGAGPNRQQRSLRTGEFKVGNSPDAGEQSTQRSEGFVGGRVSTVTRVPQSLCAGLHIPDGEGSGLERRRDYRKVYDIVNAGPRGRFTVNGALVLNCVLGLGYLMGPAKLVRAAKVQGGMDIDLDFAKTAVNVYRTKNDRIKDFWKDCKTALASMVNGEEYSFGPNGLYTAVPARGKGPATIVMPNGLNLIYTGLGTQPGKYGDDYFYYTPKGRNLVKTKIHPGQVAENLCQALARIIINDQWLRIKTAAVREKLVPRSPVVGHVYDEIICCVPTEHGQRIKEIMLHEMTIGPSWAKGLPLKAEADLAQRYGDAK